MVDAASPAAQRRTLALERLAGAASIGAALVHGGLGPAHFAEWWGYGLFFVTAAAAQLVLGLALLVGPFDEAKLRVPLRRAKRWLYAAGVAGQLVLVAFYVVTRTVGIPFFGPQAGTIEEVAPIDLVAQALQLACAGILAWLLRA